VVIVSAADKVTPLRDADILAVVFAITVEVRMVIWAVFEPAGIVMEIGTIAWTLSDRNETVKPPVGAGPDIVAVPYE